MTGLLAACWQDGYEDRAQAVFNDAKAAFRELRSAVPIASAQSENFCLSGFVGGDDTDAAFCQPPEAHLFVAYAGWIGMWENGRGSRITARQIAEHYARSATKTLSNLFGHYGLVIADPRSQQLVATVDHPGFFPLYYATEPGIVWVSSSSLCLAKALGKKFERRAALALFLSAQVRSPWSAFDGILRLRLGEELTVERGLGKLASTWSPFVTTAKYDRVEDCAEHGSELLEEACGAIEASSARSVYDLTGGLDSRLVVSAATSASSVHDVTVTGAFDSVDVRLSKMIAEELGWTWHHFPIPPEWNGSRWDYFRKAVFLNDGEMPGHNGDGTLHRKKEVSRLFDVSITGGLGELLRDFFWQQEISGLGTSSELNLDRVFRYRFSSNFSRVPSDLFDVGFLRKYISGELETANAVISEEPDSPKTMKLDALYIWKNSGHVGRYLGSSNAMLTTLAPIGLRPVIEFGLSVPYRYRLRGNLARHMILRQSNTLAGLPTAYGGSAKPYSALRPDRYLQHGLYFLSRAVRKARQIAVQRGILPSAGLTNMDDQVFRSHVEGLGFFITSNLVSAPLYKPEGLENFLGFLQRGEPANFDQIYALVSVELVCRALESSGSSSTPFS
jgi:hypothetical protein